ncbi:non-canonical ubiquitin conjugating enzyme 1 [Flagelloscypha sp. PMI_526]|nr:non-canonical ubiquitin conjugating enzyme 1 [Flagelloscypha sp. PMI_526]
MAGLNKNNSAVKRIMSEARELSQDPSTDYSAGPLEDDIFEWHCTIRGPPGTEFEGGLYHFRLLLPAEYPFKAPSIMCLTPNGRFETNAKICISFTSYHEELWQPAWGVRTAIVGVQGFFPLKGQAAAGVGSIEAAPNERKRLAALSRNWVCPHCQASNLELLPDPDSSAPAPAQDVSLEECPAVQPEPSITPSSPIASVTPSDNEVRPLSIPEKSGDHDRSHPPIPSTTQSSRHPPLFLVDGAIFVLLGLVCALLFRRLV